MVAYLFHRRLKRLQRAIAILEALGLGAYAVVGVDKCLAGGLSVAAAILVGTINAVGGGLLRDVLVREEPLLFMPGQFYVLASLAGCLMFVSLTYWAIVGQRHAEWISIVTIFGLHILAIKFNWRTAPLQPLFTGSNSSSGENKSGRSPPVDPGKIS